MWNSGPGEGGGFVSTEQGGDAGGFSSPTGDKGGGKGKRSQNIVPVTIKQLVDCQEDTFKIVDTEAQVVTFVGLVKSVEPTTTKISVHMDDQTGVIEAFYYVGSDGDGASEIPILPVEGTYGRVVGALRNMKGSKYVIIFKFLPITDMNELTCHLLEVIQVPMKLRKLKDAMAQKTGVGLGMSNMQLGGMSNMLSNSMIAGNFGGGIGGGGGGGQGNAKSGFPSNQQLVLSIIQGCMDESGVHKDEIIQSLKHKLNARDITGIIEELSGEGHIYSTVDDDHFKVTD